MKQKIIKGGEGMFDNLIEKVKGYFTSNTNESQKNENMNQGVENSSVAQEKPESLEDEKPIEPMQNNEQQDDNVEKSENEVQQGGKSKKKKKNLKKKKKRTTRKKSNKKSKKASK
tara:strand:- start:48 stop:392 length:345 start_codon:yes stop_codon:yes gene_type:complete